MPSSVIRRFVYSAQDRALAIEFVSGRRYLYRDVPPEVADGLREAESQGEYFNAHIRDRFAYEEI